MKPLVHAENSVRKWGGKIENYLAIHNWFDQTKAAHPDMRHRAVLHNAMGIYVCETVFGTYIVNSDGKKVSVRDIGEQHVIEDMGRIPTLSDFLNGMPFYDWLGGPKRKRRTINLEDNSEKTEELTGKPEVVSD